ncbi:MAG: recombinase RecT [Betaproteobacteria bacterium]
MPKKNMTPSKKIPPIHEPEEPNGLLQPKTALPIPDSSQGNVLIQALIQKEIIAAAQLIEIDPLELFAWMDLSKAVPEKNWLCLLRLIQEYRLDPLKEELFFHRYDNGQWQVLISVDGWIKLISRHPHFMGMAFTESSQMINDIPTWIECAIYRSDRTMPMVVREYFVEVKQETPIWQKMPRRILRHRALQQCARLSFGITLHDTSFTQLSEKPSDHTKVFADSQVSPPIFISHENEYTSPESPTQHEDHSSSRMSLLKEHLQHRSTS